MTGPDTADEYAACRNLRELQPSYTLGDDPYPLIVHALHASRNRRYGTNRREGKDGETRSEV